MNDKRLFLLDGMALIYRAFFAFSQNPRITSYGLNTSAVYGFANTILDLLSKEKPTHLAVVFDTDAPTERHIEFEAYKAHRQEMPEDLAKAIPFVFRLIEGFKIPVITMDGFEADDIIGTLAKKAEIAGYKTYMMTPDKDFGQLVSDNIFIYKPARLGNGAEILGVPEILQRWEIKRIDQVIDILGLMGDAVDNIPGVPGIGEKTAIKLLSQFDNIPNLLANTHELKGKQRENLENFKDQALLSRKLATIICDVPIELDEKSLEMEKPDEAVLKELFAELEFRTMAARLFSNTGSPVQTVTPAAPADLFSQPAMPSPATEKTVVDEIPEEQEHVTYATIHNTPHNYILADTEDKIQHLISLLEKEEKFCFDTETTSINPLQAELVGFSFAVKPGEAYYLPFPEDREAAKNLAFRFKNILESKTKTKIGQNLKYDLAVLQNYDIQLSEPFFDTMLAHYLLEADSRHNMDAMAEAYLKYTPVSITTLIGKKGNEQLNMRMVDVEKVKEYAAEDADITLQLYQIFNPMLDEKQVRNVFTDIELELMPVLADMEREGVKIDRDFLASYSKDLEAESIEVEKDIYRLAGVNFNIASPKQLGEVLFDVMKLDPKAKKTKTGQYQTGEEILSVLAIEHEIAKKIIDYRQLNKLKSTYVDSLPLLIDPASGRVHTSFNQAVAATGRLSSQNPNLQNIPIRTDKGREIRKAFVPRDSQHKLLAADYSQIELRIIAAMSKDAGMIEDFTKGNDIHTATASKVFGVSLENVDRDMRRKAKMVNFGIIYGISAFGLAQRLEIPRKEAAAIIEAYFQQYPNVKKYMNDTIELAREKGYVETIMGRRRYLRDINSRNQTVRGFAERNAINAPIQGSAADMIKLAMIRIHKRMKEENLESRMILQVHDELLFEARISEIDRLKELVKEGMLGAIKLDVPLEVEMGLGDNWLEAH